MAMVVCKVRPSINAADKKDAQALGVARQAVYDKINRRAGMTDVIERTQGGNNWLGIHDPPSMAMIRTTKIETPPAARGVLPMTAIEPIYQTAEPRANPTNSRLLFEAERVFTDASVHQLEANNTRVAFRRSSGKVSGLDGASELIGIKPTTLASRIKASGLSGRYASSSKATSPA